jgi:hypothetical protein
LQVICLGTSGKAILEGRSDDEGASTEAQGRAIIDVLGREKRNEVLAAVYMVPSDVSLTVQQAAFHVWKTVVAKTPKTLKEIMPVLMNTQNIPLTFFCRHLTLLQWAFMSSGQTFFLIFSGGDIQLQMILDQKLFLHIQRTTMYRHIFLNDYWEDIGTIKSFFDANLALAAQPPKFHFYDPMKPIFTSPQFLPPTKIEKCQVLDSIISQGCFLRECTVEHSVIGIRSRLEYGAELKETMMMGVDYYETEAEIASLLAEGKVPIGVGENTKKKIRNCIIDKNARIGKNVVIANSDNGV